MYEGEGRGDPHPAFRGTSPKSIEDAIAAAVHESGAEPGTTFVVTHIELETIGDPNVGSYSVIIARGGGR